MDAIEFGEFLRRTGVKLEIGSVGKIEKVISLRDITDIQTVISMPLEYLEHLLRNIGLLGDPECKPYRNSNFSLSRMDPHRLRLGQKFVYRPKYINILEKFDEVFRGFTLPRGISKLTPQIVIGRDNTGQVALAHYICPIFEEHDGEMVILDGVHRDFIIKNAGTTIQSIVIDNIAEPFPCTPHPWTDIRVVDEKPPAVVDRYFDLDKNMFRNLKDVGIDG